MMDAKSSTSCTTPVSNSAITMAAPNSNDIDDMKTSYPPARSIAIVMLALYLLHVPCCFGKTPLIRYLLAALSNAPFFHGIV